MMALGNDMPLSKRNLDFQDALKNSKYEPPSFLPKMATLSHEIQYLRK